MLPTHLPLYGQLPVLRQAEGEFAEDPGREGEHSLALRHTPRAWSQPEKNAQLKGWGAPAGTDRAAAAFHLPLFPPPPWTSRAASPRLEEKLENATQVQPLQSLTQQRSPGLCCTTDTSG